MSKAKHMKLQGVYSVAELARTLAISHGRTERILKHAKVPTVRLGGQRLVLVDDIEAQMPGLWRSVLACERARAITRALEDFSGSAR